MSTTQTTTPDLPTAAPIARGRRLPAPTQRLRRSWMLLGILLILTAAAVAYWSAQRNQARVSVLALARDVAAGQGIQRDDLAVVSLSDTTGLSTLSGDQVGQVLQRQPATALPKGSLLSEGLLRPVSFAPNEAVVGISLTPAQMPSCGSGQDPSCPAGLQAGEQAFLVPTPAAQGEPPTQAPAGVSVTVLSTSPVRDTANTVVNVRLPADQARLVAAQAATGRLALVLVPSGIK